MSCVESGKIKRSVVLCGCDERIVVEEETSKGLEYHGDVVMIRQKKNSHKAVGGADSNRHHVYTTSIFSKTVLLDEPAEHRLCI